MDLYLLDNLNMDSIKVAELIVEATRRLRLAGEFDPRQFAKGTLREVAEALEKALQAKDITGAGAMASARRKTWVRNFAIEHVPEDLSPPSTTSYNWSTNEFLVISERDEGILAEAVAKDLLEQSAKAQVVTFRDLKNHTGDNFTGYICILPRKPIGGLPLNVRLNDVIERLRARRRRVDINQRRDTEYPGVCSVWLWLFWNQALRI